MRKTMSQQSVTDESSHDSKLFVSVKVLGGLNSGSPQENLSQLRHEYVDHLVPLCKRKCRHHERSKPCAVKNNMSKHYALLFAAH